MHDEYNRAAALYDPLLSRPLHSIRRTVVRCIEAQNPQSVLDICCGTGAQLQMLIHTGCRLTGVDLSPAMLDVAKKKTSPTIDYLQADASSIPLPTNSIDTALISLALHEKPRRLRLTIFKEACRLVKENGTILIVDYASIPAGIAATIRGKILIPLIERMAGTDHYHCYKEWMNTGALAGFIERNHASTITISGTHMGGCIQIMTVIRQKGERNET